jgi:hypothetical protein
VGAGVLPAFSSAGETPAPQIGRPPDPRIIVLTMARNLTELTQGLVSELRRDENDAMRFQESASEDGLPGPLVL